MIRYQAKAALPDAIKAWAGKPYQTLPAEIPGYLPGCDDENGILAHVFAELCTMSTTTERLTHLMATIDVHQRRYNMGWDAIRGESNPRHVGSMDRSALSRLRPYEAMIEVLRIWLEELHERAVTDISAQFVDHAATRVLA